MVSVRMPFSSDHSLMVIILPLASSLVLVLLFNAWDRFVTQRQFPGEYPLELHILSMLSPFLYPWAIAQS